MTPTEPTETAPERDDETGEATEPETHHEADDDETATDDGNE